MFKQITSYTIIILLIAILAYVLIHTVRAGLVSDFSDSLSSQVISTAANHTITFTSSSNFGPDETLELWFESDFDLTNIDYTDIDIMDDDTDLNLGATPGTGTGSNIGAVISGQTITFTQNDTDTILASSVITIAIGFNSDYQTTGDNQIYNPSTADTYKISLSGTFGDMGTLSLAILNSDTVAMDAEVTPEMSFKLRNSADTADFSSCFFGSITPLGISQCAYRLAAETNGATGFQIYIQADGNFRENASKYLTNISNNSSVTQGEEGYGIEISSATGVDPQGDFSANDTPVPHTNTLLLNTDSVYNYSEGNLSTSSLITHKASVSGTTEAGVYSQQVVYSILANY